MRLRRNTLSVERGPEKTERSKAGKAFSRAAKWAATVLTGATFMLASPSSPVGVQKAQAQDPADKKMHKITKDHMPSSSVSTPIMDPPRFEIQNFVVPSSSGDELVGTSQPYSTPILDRLCDGDRELARDMVRKTGELLLTFKWEGKYTPQERREAGAALYDVLSQVPEGKEMHTSEGYSQAMQKLAGCGGQGECDLWGAIKALKGETAFNALFDSVNNIYAIAVDQVAIPIVQAGFEVSFPIDTNKDQFLRYRQEGVQRGFSLKPLSVDVGLNYRWFLLGGELMQLKLNVDEEGEIFFAKEGGKVLHSKDAHAIGLKLSFPFGWSIAGYPMEMIPFISAGWIDWGLGADITGPDGTTEPLDIGQSRVFLDFSGIEFRFPGFESENWPCRPERFAVGIAGITPHIYPLGYATGSCRWGETVGAKWKTYFTVEYGTILNTGGSYENVDKEHRIGFDWKPVVVVFQTSGNVELTGGIGFRYTVNVRPEHENYAGEAVDTSTSHIFAPSGLFSVRFKWWSEHPIAVEARFGYIWEHKGPKGETIPELAGAGTPFGSLNVVVPLW